MYRSQLVPLEFVRPPDAVSSGSAVTRLGREGANSEQNETGAAALLFFFDHVYRCWPEVSNASVKSLWPVEASRGAADLSLHMYRFLVAAYLWNGLQQLVYYQQLQIITLPRRTINMKGGSTHLSQSMFFPDEESRRPLLESAHCLARWYEYGQIARGSPLTPLLRGFCG